MSVTRCKNESSYNLLYVYNTFLENWFTVLILRNWWNCGYNNAFRYNVAKGSVGLGGNISKSLNLEIGKVPSPVFHSQTDDAGNGSLMRLAPIPIRFFKDIHECANIAYPDLDYSRTKWSCIKNYVFLVFYLVFFRWCVVQSLRFNFLLSTDVKIYVLSGLEHVPKTNGKFTRSSPLKKVSSQKKNGGCQNLPTRFSPFSDI